MGGLAPALDINKNKTNDRIDITGETITARDGYLYYTHCGQSHPVYVMTTLRQVRVGCMKLSREAWELLKKKVDGELA